MNKQNYRYWSDINPHSITEGHTKSRQRNVCAGILGNAINDPLFLSENINDVIYADRRIKPRGISKELRWKPCLK